MSGAYATQSAASGVLWYCCGGVLRFGPALSAFMAQTRQVALPKFFTSKPTPSSCASQRGCQALRRGADGGRRGEAGCQSGGRCQSETGGGVRGRADLLQAVGAFEADGCAGDDLTE